MLETGDLYFTMTEIDSSLSLYSTGAPVCGAGTLDEKQDGWNLHRLITAVHDVCKAVVYAHEQGVIHRDLKPDNIMIGPFGEVLVVDWGISKVLDAATQLDQPVQTTRSSSGTNHTLTGAIYGTPAYLAPELARADGSQPTAQTDVYALGAILYETLRGQRPFDGLDPDTLLTKLSSGAVEPFDTLFGETERDTDTGFDERPMHYVSARGLPLPEFLVNVCHKAMSTHPTERYQTA